MELSTVVGHPHHISNADLARGLGGLAVGLNSAEFTRARGQRPRLEESGGPEPFVDSYGGHGVAAYTQAILVQSLGGREGVRDQELGIRG